jgi:hypothetical protein
MSMRMLSNNKAVLVICRSALAFAWIYQGAVPKIVCRSSGEVELLGHLIPVYRWACEAVTWMGAGEIVFGFLLFAAVWSWVYWLNIAALTALTLFVLLFERDMFTLPFNPLTLNVALIALSLVAIVELKKNRKEPAQ